MGTLPVMPQLSDEVGGGGQSYPNLILFIHMGQIFML